MTIVGGPPAPGHGSSPPLPSLRDGSRVEITGGQPTHEEIAALVVALDAAVAGAPAAPRPPAWLLAARLESVGQRLVTAPADLRAFTR